MLTVISCGSISPRKRVRKEQAPLEFSTKYPNGYGDISKQLEKEQNRKIKGPIKNKFK